LAVAALDEEPGPEVQVGHKLNGLLAAGDALDTCGRGTPPGVIEVDAIAVVY
jgi:hypothetical protein